MKTTRENFTQPEVEMISEIMANNKLASEHPYYQNFKTEYAKFYSGDESHIEAIWNELIEGYRVQPDNVRLSSSAKNNKEYLDIINNNPHFIQAVKMIKGDKGLMVPQDKELALWSGGYELSVIARKIGFCTLEGTFFGNLLDNLKVTWEWEREEALWNILSKSFVEEYAIEKQVHVYFRNVDEMCVLFEQELSTLMKDDERVIVMHPIYNLGTQTKEVGYNFSEKRATTIDVEEKSRVFAYKASDLKENIFQKGFLPYEALISKIGISPNSNQKVYVCYRSEAFIPGHAPFAREDERTSGFESQKQERAALWGK